MQACSGPGKTATLAWMGLNGLLCYGGPGQHPKGAVLSCTAENLRDNLWPEFTRWIELSPLLQAAFEQTSERIMARDHRQTWFLSARTFAKTANEDEQGRTLSGLHGPYVFILIDESGETPVAVLKAGEQAFSEKGCKFARIAQAGNPTSTAGMLYAAATKLAHLWLVIPITGDPDDPDRSPRIDEAWAREQIETYGRDDPWVMAYILGKFPETSLNTLLSVNEVQAAMARHLPRDVYGWVGKRIGVDVARFGLAATVLFPRQGLAAFQPEEMRGADSHQVAARVIAAKARWAGRTGERVVAYVDATGGYGAGVIDALVHAGHHPVPVEYAGKATDPKFFNKRSEIWWNMAQWVKRGGALPQNARVTKELTQVQYALKKGKLWIEEKEQIVKRLRFSCDYADALANTFAAADAPAEYEAPTPEAAAARAQADLDYGAPKDEYDPHSKDRW